jgi:hypothetical protein
MPKTVLDPCAGAGNLTKPFTDNDPTMKVISFEKKVGTNFLRHKRRIKCDLVLCNPPFGKWQPFLAKILKVVGTRTPIVLLCPRDTLLGYKNSKNSWYNWLVSQGIEVSAVTALPKGSFVESLTPALILWINLPAVRSVGVVPPKYLVARHDWVPQADAVDVRPRTNGQGGKKRRKAGRRLPICTTPTPMEA